jgi:LysR family glycine cleavage system transcriptional activator
MLRNLRSLQALIFFESAGRHRSLKQAAAELHVTPSAVSRQIRALEGELGVALFRRLHRGIDLTEEGAAYLAEVGTALARLDHATEHLRTRRDTQPLRLSVLQSFAGNWLVPRLPAFEAAHPGIDVRMEATTAYADFSRDPVDLAIRFGRGPWPGLHSEPLVALDFFPVCRPSLRNGPAPLRRPADLAGHTWLEEVHVPGAWPAWLDAAGVAGIRPQRTLQYDNAQLMLEAAMAGQGVALATRIIADRYLREGRLIRRSVTVASALTIPGRSSCRPESAARARFSPVAAGGDASVASRAHAVPSVACHAIVAAKESFVRCAPPPLACAAWNSSPSLKAVWNGGTSPLHVSKRARVGSPARGRAATSTSPTSAACCRHRARSQSDTNASGRSSMSATASPASAPDSA